MTTLDVFRAPESVAVVGATDNPAKWGHWLARGAVAGAHRRRVHLVNTRGGQVLGRATLPGLDALPEVPDLVAFAVPSPALADGVSRAVALGVPGLLAITAGVEDEAAIGDVIAESGSRLLGPNSLGLYDASSELELAWGRFTPGGLAIVSQSGQLGLEIAGMAASAGIGVSRFVSVGSQLDVCAAELLADLAHHEATRVVAVYLESFGDGERLLDALDHLREAGKPVLLLTVGDSRAAQQAARSHTGAMTSGLDVVDAACRTVGAVRVDTPAQLVDAAQLLSRCAPVRGRRVAIVADSGGQGAVGADTASRLGLTVAEFPRLSRSASRTGCRRTPRSRTPSTSPARVRTTSPRTRRHRRSSPTARSPMPSCSVATSAATVATSPNTRRPSRGSRGPSAPWPPSGRFRSWCTRWPNIRRR